MVVHTDQNKDLKAGRLRMTFDNCYVRSVATYRSDNKHIELFNAKRCNVTK